MVPESTPSTPEDVAAALAATIAAQDPEPWAPSLYYPRQLGNAPAPIMAYDTGGHTTVQVMFDNTLDDTPSGNGNWEVVVQTAPSTFSRKVVTVDETFDTLVTLLLSGGTSDPGPAQVTYSGDDDPPLTGVDAEPVIPFTMLLQTT